MATHTLSNSNYQLVLTLVQGAQSIGNNNSIVRVRYSVRKLAGSGFWDTTPRPFNLYVNGGLIIDSTTTFDFRRYSELVLWEGNVTVAHNADGSKTVAAAGYFNGDRIGAGTVNESLKLVDIPRKSSFTVPGSFVMGNPLPVTISRVVARFKHVVRLTYRVGNVTHTLISQTNVDTTTTLPMTEAQIKTLCEAIPKELKTTVSVVVETFDGSRSLGSTSTPVVANVPSSVVPSVTGVTRTWLNGMNEVPDFDNEIYKDFTKITFNPSGAAGMYGSTITSSQYSAPDFSDFRFTKTGNKTVTLTVTDSRGRTASTTTTVNVLEITLPKLSVSWIRCNANGAPNPFGLYARPLGYISGTGRFFLAIWIKETGQQVWHRIPGNAPSDFPIEDAFDVTGNIQFLDPDTSFIHPGTLYSIGIASVASDKTYDVRVRLQHAYWQWCDIPMESNVQDIVATTKVALDVGVENIGVGKIYTPGRGSGDFMDQIFQNNGIAVPNGFVRDVGSEAINVEWLRNNPSGIYTSSNVSGGTPTDYGTFIVISHTVPSSTSTHKQILYFGRANGGMWNTGINQNSSGNLVWRMVHDSSNTLVRCVETGSNANWKWKRWSDGTVELDGVQSITTPVTSTWGPSGSWFISAMIDAPALPFAINNARYSSSWAPSGDHFANISAAHNNGRTIRFSRGASSPNIVGNIIWRVTGNI